MSENSEVSTGNEMWATVELMGHDQTAGRISRPSDWGGLLRVDVPSDGAYRTEFIGPSAIFRVRLVSEEIARAFVQPSRAVIAYDTPIVTREQHQAVVHRLEEIQSNLRNQVTELERRLVAVRASLPPPDVDEVFPTS